MKKNLTIIFFLLAINLAASVFVYSQSTEFTYQGSLSAGGIIANGNYDFEFALFDALAGGNPLGATISANNVAVSNGIFNVKLDFGNQFSGANRFLEIRVRQTGGGAFTPLAPRQSVNSTPYSVKSLNATTATNADQLGGINANQFVVTSDLRLSDARTPTPGSGNYIQNTTSLQATGNFNISGTGTANILNATTQLNINEEKVLSFPNANLFLGRFAGYRSIGDYNTFVGNSAGIGNTEGRNNSFFGRGTGQNNLTGNYNSFFGSTSAGGSNSSGSFNSFFGSQAGQTNTTGSNNTFIGYLSGPSNLTGTNLTLIGNRADVTGDGLVFATAIGSGALVQFSNMVVLGRPADTVLMPGKATIGIPLQQYGNLNIIDPSSNANFFMAGDGASRGINFGVDSTTTTTSAKLFISQYDGVTYLDRLTINEDGTVGINVLGSAGATALCRNASNKISTCSSSIRYKSNVADFTPGLNVIKKLRPVSFNWKDGGIRDMGLVAEEVAEIEPLLTTTNEKGEIEGVKYDRVGVVLVNAVQEQQLKIENLEKQNAEQTKIISQQQEKLDKQQMEFEAMKAFICSQNPTAVFCQPKEN